MKPTRRIMTVEEFQNEIPATPDSEVGVTLEMIRQYDRQLAIEDQRRNAARGSTIRSDHFSMYALALLLERAPAIIRASAAPSVEQVLSAGFAGSFDGLPEIMHPALELLAADLARRRVVEYLDIDLPLYAEWAAKSRDPHSGLTVRIARVYDLRNNGLSYRIDTKVREERP